MRTPENILVIMEKAGDVPGLEINRLVVSPRRTVGNVKDILRRKINFAAEKDIFVFVNNTLPPADALMSAIYEEQKDEDGFLYMTYSGEDIITELLFTTKISLDIVESILEETGPANIQLLPKTWPPYLSALEMLVSISASQETLMERTKAILKSRMVAFSSLVTNFAGLKDREWVLKLGSTFEIRNHFTKMMFTYEDQTFYLHVDRSNLLTQSFEEIAKASPSALQGEICVYFTTEEADGGGVLQEWFYTLSQMIFQQKKHLFVESADDSRRFQPKPALKVDDRDLEFYRFTGRVFALAIKHGVQVGILLDPIFFLNLGGRPVCFEDIKKTDKAEYMSCLRLLAMKEEEFDQDGMSLTFSVEIEEEGKNVEIPLCEKGEEMNVNFKNKKLFIDMRTQHLYVTLVKDQVSEFARGFEEMISVSHKTFFDTMELEDIDCLLRGEEDDAICIKKWRSFTDYKGFRETDSVIQWFWDIVNGMDQERQHNLLFFWTARMYLPIGGFEELPQRFTIIREDSKDHFPESKTCLFQSEITYVTDSDICAGFGSI